MSTYEFAENESITVNGIKYAYRLFGADHGIPLVMHMHFRGNMDWWDPALLHPLAVYRPVLLIDNAGIGRSEGSVPETIAGQAQVIIDVVKALQVPQVDVLGFSSGGFIAQMMALNAPTLVRKLILAGTGPSAGEGVLHGDPQYFARLVHGQTEADIKAAMVQTFFAPSEKKQQVGEQWWHRTTSSRPNRAPLAPSAAIEGQLKSGMRFATEAHGDENSYSRLHEIKIPVLVANGSNDLLMPTENSYVLWKKLVNAQAHLHLYPDSGHGFLYEYHDHFSELINTFLEEKV